MSRQSEADEIAQNKKKADLKRNKDAKKKKKEDRRAANRKGNK